MKDGPSIAALAALVGDPARANMLTALMDGRALTVTELAQVANIALPTASGHLARMDEAGLVVAEKQGRHRYHRLAGYDVAEMLESLMHLAQRTGATRVRTGPRDDALREARICYDHLAGTRGVSLWCGLIERGWIEGEGAPRLTALGQAGLAESGVDVVSLERGRRPVCRNCLDWSERRNHLGGALGAAMLDHVLARRWARRWAGRVVAFSPGGASAFEAAFGTEA